MRTLVVDEAGVRGRLTKAMASSSPMQAGVVIGRRPEADDREYLLLAVPLPAEAQQEGATHVAGLARGAVQAHVQQVGRMLPGGLSVLGLYAVSPDQGKQAVEALQRLWPSSSSPSLSLVVLLHVSTQSSQWTWRTGPPKGELAAVETKYQEGVARQMTTYRASWRVHFSFPAPPTRTIENHEEEEEIAKVETLLRAEDSFFRAFLKAVQVVGQGMHKALGFPVPGGREPPSLGPFEARRIEFYTSLLVEEGEGANLSTGKPPHTSGTGHHRPVQVTGTVACVACVHEKEDVQAGIQALKEDLAHSLRDRVQVLRQEAAAEVEDAQGTIGPDCLSHAIHLPAGGSLWLPRRVLLPLEGSLPLTDYLLPGEVEEDAVGRMRDMFGGGAEASSSSLLVLEQEGVAAAAAAAVVPSVTKDNKPSPGTMGSAQTKETEMGASIMAPLVIMVGVGFLLLAVAAVLWQQQHR